MKIKLMAFLLIFSSSLFPSEPIMSMVYLILSSAISFENNSSVVHVKTVENKYLHKNFKIKNKMSDKCPKKANFKRIKNNIQQPTKRNF